MSFTDRVNAFNVGSDVLGKARRLPVQPERRFQGRDRELPAAQRPMQRVLGDLGQPDFLPDDETRLRSAEDLVAAEGHDVRAKRDTFRDERLLRQAVLAQVDERAAPKIFHHRNAVRLADRHKLGERHFGGKADDAVVAGVDLQEQRGLVGDRLLVIRRMRAVRRPDLLEHGAALGHDLRNPEGAADLNQLAARDDHFLAVRERVERQQHGGGVVVDHGGGLGAGERLKKRLDDIFSFAALALLEVVFEIDGIRAYAGHRVDGRLRQQRASQVRVEHGAGRVHDPNPAMEWHDRISVNPAVRSGKPCIKGTRITVYDVLEYLAGGMTEDAILSDFPDLTRDDIRAALAFAAARERRLANSVA